MSGDGKDPRPLNSGQKRDLLLSLMREDQSLAKAYPVSFAQRRLWFLDQMAPGSPFYNQYVTLDLPGEADPELLSRAINEIVRRHGSLRTRFATLAGKPIQWVLPRLEIDLRLVDLGHLPAAALETEALRIGNEEVRRPFDLSTGPLLRALLIRLGRDLQLLVLTLHHIVSDGLSMSILLEELQVLYEAFAYGRPSPLPPLPIQYSDYAVWQQEWLEGRTLERQLDYWKTKLKGMQPLEIPSDRPRPAIPSFRGGCQTVTPSPELAQSARRLAREAGASLFMVLLAAFQAWLSRYCGQSDIVVGSPVANRGRAELENLIGFFVNTLVMREDFSDDPSFRAAVDRVKNTALEAFTHQDLPFEKLVEELQPERDTSRNPLYQVTFQVFGDFETDDSPRQHAIDLDAGTSVFDLSATAFDTGDGLRLQFEYSGDLFDAITARRMLESFEAFLESAVADPDRKISELNTLPASHWRLLAGDWNDTAEDLPADLRAERLAVAWARSTPDATALESDGQRVTYRELDRRTEAIARSLRARGVGVGDIVAVQTPPGPDFVLAALAVWRAGAAYLPIDAGTPGHRVEWMTRDSGANLLLTEPILRELERDADPGAPPLAEGSLDDPAYLIYTSGSTGRPKGVLVGHRSLLNLIWWHRRRYDLKPRDRMTQAARVSFDASVWEIWPCLAAGATLRFVPAEVLSEAPSLVEWLAREQITVCFLPTPLAEEAVGLEWPDNTALRVLLTGGDRLRRPPERRLPFALVNHYGPTETAVVATCAEIPSEASPEKPPPIGKPIANTRVYLLDRHGRPVAVGARGELCIAGEGVAFGYHGRPALTAASYLPCPWGPSGSRMFRTGDAARFRGDGKLEFLGRFDRQVKIRGFRIEPGEIEAVLMEHESVAQAAVVARGSGLDKKLSAFVSLRPGSAAGALREYLRARLPEYMMPASIVALDRFPLSPNGKIDIAALPDPGRPDDRPVSAPPVGQLQNAIAQVWRDVLGLEEVGVHDNFFDVGGHSLLLVKLRAKLEKVLPGPVSVIDLFKNPTIAALSERFSGEPAEARSNASVRARADLQRKALRATIGEHAMKLKNPKKFSPQAKLALGRASAAGSETARVLISTHGRLEPADMEKLESLVGPLRTVAGDVVTAEAGMDKIAELGDLDCVRYVEVAGKMRPEADSGKSRKEKQ